MHRQTTRGEARHRVRHRRRSVILLLTATVGVVGRSAAGATPVVMRRAVVCRHLPNASTPSGWHVHPPGSLTSWDTVRCCRRLRTGDAKRGRVWPTEAAADASGRQAASGTSRSHARPAPGALRRRQSPRRGRAPLPRHDVDPWPPRPNPRRVPPGHLFGPCGSRDRRRRSRVRGTSHPDYVTSTTRAHGPVRDGWRTASARTASAAAAS